MASNNASTRLDSLDAVRALALVWMGLYHLVFDLSRFGFVRQDFYRDPVWTLQRTAILGLFLLCAGMGQAIAVYQGQTWPRFWRRWFWIAGGAVLVSAGSWLMYPRSFIYFGVLHGMALMLPIVRLTAGCGAWLWLVGLAAVLAAPSGAAMLAGSAWAEAFNAPALNWLGLITRKPVTEDYVPMLPWLGVAWWGAAIGHWWMGRAASEPRWQARAWAARALTRLGRWSLPFYLLHQPVLIGGVMLARALGA